MMTDKIKQILDNEEEFHVENRWAFGDMVVMQVDYPNCPPQVRKKILVFKGNAPPVDATRILPHFGHETSPCARFNVDQNGWNLATKFALEVADKKRDQDELDEEITPERVCTVLEGLLTLEWEPEQGTYEDIVYKYTHLAREKTCKHPKWAAEFLTTEREVLKAMDAPSE